MSKVFIALIVITSLVFIILIGMAFFSPRQPITPSEKNIPTPTIYLLPTSVQNAFKEPIPIASDTGKKMLEKVTKRHPLTNEDIAIRKKLIAKATSEPGNILYSSSLFAITYIRVFDLFQVEIMASDILSIKQKAVKFFLDQGITQDGICDLPIMFILNENVADQIRGTNNAFDLLPPGC